MSKLEAFWVKPNPKPQKPNLSIVQLVKALYHWLKSRRFKSLVSHDVELNVKKIKNRNKRA